MKQITLMAAVAIAWLPVWLSAAEPIPCPDCPPVKKVCRTLVEPGKEPRLCWQVEREEICIPAVNFPWSKCRPPRCGHVRTVNVLKLEEVEIDVCQYRWEIEALPPCGPVLAPCGPALPSYEPKSPAWPGR